MGIPSIKTVVEIVPLTMPPTAIMIARIGGVAFEYGRMGRRNICIILVRISYMGRPSGFTVHDLKQRLRL